MRFLPLMLIFVSSLCYAQQVRYVSDTLRITLRSGKGTSYNVIAVLTSGAKMELLNEDDEHALVRTEDGKEGWVRLQYLSEEPSARNELEQTQARMQELNAQQGQLKSQLTNLSTDHESLQQENTLLLEQNAELTQQLAAVSELAARPLELEEENKTLLETTSNQEQQITTLNERNSKLANTQQREWFLIGGGVSSASVLLGILLGLIFSRLKKRRWGEI